MNQSVLQSKVDLVNEVASKLEGAASSVVVEYRGLSVAEITELRRALRTDDVEFKVYKNTIVKRAAEQAGHKDMADILSGPNAFAFGSDSVAPSRVLVKFAKKHPSLILKGGIVENEYFDADALTTLSALPNKEGMISMLLGCLQSPIRSFACAIKAVAEARESDGEEVKENAAEPAAEAAA